MEHNAYSELYDFILSISDNTVEQTKVGGIGIGYWGKYPLFPYDHMFYKGVTDQHVSDQQAVINIEIPNELRQFYRYASGLSLFRRKLNIYGWPFHRDTLGQPISIRYGNLNEIPKGKPDDIIIIGSFHYSGTEVRYIYMTMTGECGVTPREVWEPEAQHSTLVDLIKMLWEKYSKEWYKS